MLTSILTAARCADCQNCCVFAEESAWELPTFSKTAVEPLADARPDIRRTPLPDGERYALTLPYDASHSPQACPFLHPQTGCTLPPEEKPFACSIWPIRIMERDGQPALALYQGCPGMPDTQLPALRQLLADGLETRIWEEVARDPSLILPYHPNYRFL